MTLKNLVLGLLFCFTIKTSKAQTVFTSDIHNFWIAVDSVNSTSDSLRKLEFMQALYLDKGTTGLNTFMKLRNFDAKRLLKTIKDYPLFWNSVRESTLKIEEQKEVLEHYIKKFKLLYPDYREAYIYYTITAIRSGGTTEGNLVLIGTEIAVGNKYTDVSEFPDKRLENFFKNQSSDDVIPITIHEYVHTQQKGLGVNLLAHAILEGSCDFITELVLETSLNYSYLEYGRKNETEVKSQFFKEMYSDDFTNWLYNGSKNKETADLGYFMGYAISKAYYEQASNKKKAIKDIIELDYTDSDSVQKFLDKSGYYN